MIKILLTLISTCILFQYSISQTDSINKALNGIEEKIKRLENKTDEVKRDQLNYSIEKSLLKETYSNNYETINFVLTIVLGIIGVLGYLGIRDINSIKKEYQQELEKLKGIKNEFDIKSKTIDEEKVKIDTDIREIIKQNEEQNNKIKLLELKDKVYQLIKDNQSTTALEYCAIGLELSPNDTKLLNAKGLANSRLHQLDEALKSFEKAVSIDPTNKEVVVNYLECLLLANKIDKAKDLINQNEQYLKEYEDGSLLSFFNLIEYYHTSPVEQFLTFATSLLDLNNLSNKTKRFKHWNLREAMAFAHSQPHTSKKIILQNLLWYLDGQIDSQTVYNRINIHTNEQETI